MTEDERATELANMHRCLDAAAKVWTQVAQDRARGYSAQEEIMAVLGLVFPTPLAEHRQTLVMEEITATINEYELSSCGLFAFAHMLMHIIFDEDVPRH